MINGTSSAICSSAYPLDFLPDMPVASPLLTVLQEGQDSLLAGHVKSRIILESVTKEEGEDIL